MTYDVVVDGKTHHLELSRGDTTWHCKVDDQEIEVDAALTARDVMSVLVGGKAYEVKRERSLQGELHLVIGSARYAVDVQDPRRRRWRRSRTAKTNRSPARQDRAHPGRGRRRGQGRQRHHRHGSDEDAERDEIAQRRQGAEDPDLGRIDGESWRYAGGD